MPLFESLSHIIQHQDDPDSQIRESEYFLQLRATLGLEDPDQLPPGTQISLIDPNTGHIISFAYNGLTPDGHFNQPAHGAFLDTLPCHGHAPFQEILNVEENNDVWKNLPPFNHDLMLFRGW